MRRRGCWCELCLAGDAMNCETSSMTGEWCGPHNYWEDYDASDDIWKKRMVQVVELQISEPNPIGDVDDDDEYL